MIDWPLHNLIITIIIDYLTEHNENITTIPLKIPEIKRNVKGRIRSNATSETSIWRNSWIKLPLLARIPFDDFLCFILIDYGYIYEHY